MGKSKAAPSKTRRKRGRPEKLSKESHEAICRAIRLMATREMAAQSAGIGVSTLYRWLAEGREGKSKATRELWEDVQKAEGAACVAALARIEQAAATGTWQAAAWKLERRYPEQFGRHVQTLTGPDNGPVKIELVWDD